MSDMGLEAPDADAAEQEREIIPEPTDSDQRYETPLEADPGDTAEQTRALDLDEDEYR